MVQDPSALGVFFKPRSVALVGASSDPRKPGHTALKNMISLGYQGKIYPLNPREESVLGLPCFKSVLDIPEPLDLCVLLVSAELSLQVAKELAQRKSRHNDVSAVVCMSAGFGELNTSEAGQRERDLVQTLRSASIRLIGPNCLGVMDTASGFNTNFDIGSYPRGAISVLTQSGAFGNSFLLWAGSTGRVGLNKFVSIGNMADVDMAELLAFLRNDESTRVIGIYLEGLSDPRGFFQAAREVTAVKPVVLLKSGRSEKGTTAALSHTGAVAGTDAIYEGAFKQAGVIRTRSVSEFYDTLRAFGKQPAPAGPRVCVLTHMGGPGTLCIDEISTLANLQMAEFSPETAAALKGILAPAANVGRPGGYIDMTAAHYENLHNQALKLLFRDQNIDAVIQILAPSAFLDQKLLAKEIASAYASQTEVTKPLLNVVTFGSFANELRQGLENEGLPTFDYPDSVARVAANMAAFAAQRRAAAPRVAGPKNENPQGAPSAVQLIRRARDEGRISLLEPEAYEVCRQYGIRVPPSQLAHTLEEALGAAVTIGYPVALKVVSAQILHKTDVGGVMLGVGSAADLDQSYGRLIENTRRAAPHAHGVAVLVQKMMPAATELALGGIRDKLFGPAVMFGLGGIYVEVLGRVGFRLAPLEIEEASELIHEALPPAVISGVRGREKLNLDSIALALVCLGRMLAEQPQVDQVDLNPVLAYHDGCVAVDARIIIRKTGIS